MHDLLPRLQQTRALRLQSHTLPWGCPPARWPEFLRGPCDPRSYPALTTQDRALGGLGRASLPWWCWGNHLLAVATCFVHPGTEEQTRPVTGRRASLQFHASLEHTC